MKPRIPFAALLSIVLIALPAFAQNHQSNWLQRNMMDTTIVHGWNDSLTTIHCPPGAMGMMMPDSMYCRIDIMPMDSMHHPQDSMFIGWCRVMMGEDSLHFSYMHCDSAAGHGGHHSMQFMRGLQCSMRWDSLRCDSTRRHWRPTGIRGWNGTDWVTVSGVTFTGNTATFTTSQLYSAYAFVGEPSSSTTVGEQSPLPATFELSQNYPNPFNPTTTIQFQITAPGVVHLAIFNPLGQQIKALVNQPLSAGTHVVTWDGKNDHGDAVTSGLYLYRLTSSGGDRNDKGSATRKMLLVK